MADLDRDVLIVEDDGSVAQAIADGVRLAGYTVCAICATGAEAVDWMRRRRPPLAIIDVELDDDMSGVEAARQMQRIGPIGILFVTGFPDTVRAADVGHAWMPKPYRVLDLINGLEVVRAISTGGPLGAPLPAALRLISERRR
jgi:DNA-binding response OmpR family regulator